jgi:tRNA A-37 threonylcarbamoyl transferase component Bud32/tetratricopeptide (TPR) repeat protein
MSFKAGETIGAYRIIEQLGQGGMATVFKAYHAALDRYVAIKVLHPAFMEDKNFLVRFQREARVVARLEHPNIVPIYDYAEHEGRPYLVMKYIEGETLKAHIVRGGMKPAEVTRIVEAVGAGLAYAHKQGILHRDIKPSNVILANDGNIYIADFGLARIAQSGESTMSSDMVLGTPQYISPEQAMGKRDLDAGTDIYSFGVMLYEMVVGQVPFSGDTPFAVIHDHIYSPLPLPTVANPNTPPEVERVLLKALAKERADRYEDVAGLVDAFGLAWQNHAPTQAIRQPEAVAPAPSAPPSAAPAIPAAATVAAAAPTAPTEKKKFKMKWWMWVGLVLIVTFCCLLLGALSQRGKNQTGSGNAKTQAAQATQPAQQTPPPAPPTQLVAPTQPPAESDPAAQLRLALAAWQQKDMARSMEAVKSAADTAGNNNDFLLAAGQQLFDAQHFVGAAFMYGRAGQNLKNNNQPIPPELRERVEQSYYFGAEMDGLPLYLPFDVVQKSEPGIGFMAQARYATLRGNLEIAKRSLDELLKTQPDWPVAKLVQAEYLQKTGKLLEARQMLTDLTTLPDTPPWVKDQANNLLKIKP